MPIPHAPWFTEVRLGTFDHRGLTDAYPRYFEHFDPDLSDPTAWARAAEDAGMKHAVLTTKHHEGFCPWDSKLTDFTRMRDIPPDTPALTTGVGGQPAGTLTLTLPLLRPDVEVPVVELFLR